MVTEHRTCGQNCYKKAAASFHATLGALEQKPEDLMPWKRMGEKWHNGDKGFPPGRKIRWDRAALARAPEREAMAPAAVKVPAVKVAAAKASVPADSPGAPPKHLRAVRPRCGGMRRSLHQAWKFSEMKAWE